MIGAEPGTYVEFDLTEKLKGSFEERASILQASVGAPWLTRNEARADNNLPPIEGGDELITPLNVTEGGPASPQDATAKPYNYPGEDNQGKGKKLEPCNCKACKEAEEIRVKAKSDKEDDDKVTELLTNFFKRQAKSVLPKVGADPENFWDADRWDKELAEDLEPVLITIADKHGKATAEVLNSEYTEEKTRAYIKKASQARAKNINKGTYKKIVKDLEEEEPDTAHVFEVRENTSDVLGRSAAAAMATFALCEAANQAIEEGTPSVVGRVVQKEWVTGANARPSHAAMNGERVPIDADFSNGQHWPGEDTGDPDESCGCNCTTEVIIGG